MKSLLRASSPYSVNKIASICAITAMKDKEYVKNYVKEIKKSKQILYYGLKCLKIPFYESDTNFVVANFGNNCDYVYNKLKKKGILVRNISKYPLLSGCLRIGIGTKEQTRQLINALDEINYAYLFDIDGVLVDVSDSYRVAIKKTAEYFLKEKISYNEIASFKNIPGYNNDWDLTEAIIRKRKVTVDKKKIINKFQELYGNLVENEKWILDKKLLKQLSKKYKLGIITGRPKKEAECVLKRFKADKFFQIIIAMEDAAQKPNPAGINLALKKLKATTGLYIGDTINDVMAANNAGINYIDINELDEVLRNQRFLVPRKEVLK